MRSLLLALVLLATPGCGHAASPSRGAPPQAAEEVRTLLAELVAVDTSNPPGNEAAAARVAARWLGEAGIESQLLEPAPGRAHLLARLKGTGRARPLLVLAHLDTVPARREEWSTDPWQLTERNGFLYGRGVQDNKGMAAASILALRRLQREGKARSRDILLLLSADEEVDSGLGIEWLLKNHPELREVELAINEGGLTELSADRRQVRFVAIQAAERVYRDVVLRATGPGGHSSAPPAEPNPLVRVAAAVARVGALTFPTRLTPLTRLYLEGRLKLSSGELGQALQRVVASPEAPPPEAVEAIWRLEPAVAAVLRTTCVPTVFNSGTRPNVIPPVAEATVNCRLLPDEDLQAFRARLVEAVGDPTVQVELNMTPPNSPASPVGDNAMFRAARAAAARVWPGAPVFPRMSTGTTESTALRRAGVHAYGIDLVALTPEDASTAHAPNERIPVASLQPGAEFVYQLISELVR